MTGYLNIQQASDFLHIPQKTLYMKVAAGIVPAYKPARRWIFKVSDLNEWVERTSNQKRVDLRSGKVVSILHKKAV